MLSGKKSFFIALAEYHQAAVAKDKGGYGEQVSRLKVPNLFYYYYIKCASSFVLVSYWLNVVHVKVGKCDCCPRGDLHASMFYV